MLQDKYDLMSKMVMRPIKIPTKKRNERGNRGKGGARGAGAGGDNTWQPERWEGWEHGGAGLLNVLNKQPAPQLARLPLGPSQPKHFGTCVIQACSSPARPGRGLGPIR